MFNCDFLENTLYKFHTLDAKGCFREFSNFVPHLERAHKVFFENVGKSEKT